MQKVYMVMAGMALVFALRWMWWMDLFSLSSYSWTGRDFDGRRQCLDVESMPVSRFDMLGVEVIAQALAALFLVLLVHVWLSDVAGKEWGRYMGLAHFYGAIWSIVHSCVFAGRCRRHYAKLKQSLKDNKRLCDAYRHVDKLTGGTGDGGSDCEYASKLEYLISVCDQQEHGDARNSVNTYKFVMDTTLRAGFVLDTLVAALAIAVGAL